MTTTIPPVVEQRSYIEGSWVELKDTGRPLCDPNTGETRQQKLTTPAEDVERAIAAAYAFDQHGIADWIPLSERAKLLEAVADEIDRRQEEIALQDSMNTGTPIMTARMIASSLGSRIRSAVSDALALGNTIELGTPDRPVRLLRSPIGPASIIGPWNAPTFTTVGKVAAALLAGCPVLLKPSENAPSGTQLFSEILGEEISRNDLPGGYFQLVHGPASVGQLLTDDARIAALSFTGGVDSGRTVAMAGAASLAVMQMELGSNNPVIVREDADVATTAAAIVQGVTRLNGQWCEAPGKVLVHEKLHDALIDALHVEFEALQIGHALEPQTELGPLAFQRHRDSLLREVARLQSLGGSFLGSDELPDLNGWFISPGLISGLAAHEAVNELFGPLVTVHSCQDDRESLMHANAPGGGLDAFVFGTDIEAAVQLGQRMRAGEVRINGTHMSDLAEGSQQSFWGTSGIGGHSPQYGVRFFLGDRVVGVDSSQFRL